MMRAERPRFLYELKGWEDDGLMVDMDGSLLLLGVKGVELTVEEAGLFRRLQPAGFVLFSRNVESALQVRRLTDELRSLCEEEPILAIDQEGGRVERTKAIAPSLPSAEAFGAKPDEILIARAGAVTGDLLRLLGLNTNFAPVLDLDYFPGLKNGLNQRSWGRDAQDVIDRAGVWNRWMRRRGILGCGKHFPACGRALVDPHDDLPVAEVTIEEMMREDVLPYTALMPELDAVMLAHVRFPKVDAEFPASLSKRLISGWLRGQLGFDDHVVMTDDLDMGAIQKRYGRGEDVKLAIGAGNDLAMICHQVESAEVAARAIGELSLDVRDDARRRLARFRKKMSAPLSWSEKSWEVACEEIRKIAAEVPECGDADERSAVAGY